LEARTPTAIALRQLPDGRWTWKRDPRPSAALSEAERRATTLALWRAARALPQPTLVLRGELSKILAPEVAERFVRELPQGRLVEIPRAGHSLHGDAPALFARALEEFLRDAGTNPLPTS
jgi:esterase